MLRYYPFRNHQNNHFAREVIDVHATPTDSPTRYAIVIVRIIPTLIATAQCIVRLLTTVVIQIHRLNV